MSQYAETFEELEIWRDARGLYKQIHAALEGCRDFSFRDQMRRAALSVMNNIAEGFERKTPRDFAHFLDMAKGSAGEVRSMCYAAEDVGILSGPDAETLRSAARTLSKRIAAFTRTIRP